MVYIFLLPKQCLNALGGTRETIKFAGPTQILILIIGHDVWKCTTFEYTMGLLVLKIWVFIVHYGSFVVLNSNFENLKHTFEKQYSAEF